LLRLDGRRQKPLTDAAWAVINERLTAVIAERLCQERWPDKYGSTVIYDDFFLRRLLLLNDPYLDRGGIHAARHPCYRDHYQRIKQQLGKQRVAR
jgi:hypothetical protein